MNYRHIYHAGNFADVVKHIILARSIDYLKRKPGAFRVIDTHAGIGVYDLSSEEAQKTGEWKDGIGRLLDANLPDDAAELIAPYLNAVRAANRAGGLTAYPGSPAISRHLLRNQDRLTAIELHPADAETLKMHFAGDFQTRVIEIDGWLVLGAHLPPKESAASSSSTRPSSARASSIGLSTDWSRRTSAGRAGPIFFGIR